MCLAGACWACVNGTYMVLVTFAPPLLVERGLVGGRGRLRGVADVLGEHRGGAGRRAAGAARGAGRGRWWWAASRRPRCSRRCCPSRGIGWPRPILARTACSMRCRSRCSRRCRRWPCRRSGGRRDSASISSGSTRGCTGFPPIAGWLADLHGRHDARRCSSPLGCWPGAGAVPAVPARGRSLTSPQATRATMNNRRNGSSTAPSARGG